MSSGTHMPRQHTRGSLLMHTRGSLVKHTAGSPLSHSCTASYYRTGKSDSGRQLSVPCWISAHAPPPPDPHHTIIHSHIHHVRSSQHLEKEMVSTTMYSAHQMGHLTRKVGSGAQCSKTRTPSGSILQRALHGTVVYWEGPNTSINMYHTASPHLPSLYLHVSPRLSHTTHIDQQQLTHTPQVSAHQEP